MLGRSKLITFAVRALVLLILLSVLWANVARPYNDVPAAVAGPLMSDDLSVRTLGSHLSLEHPNIPKDMTIDGLTLYFDLVLMGVLVLAAVGVPPVARIGWRFALWSGAFAVHVVGVALLGQGLPWTGDPGRAKLLRQARIQPVRGVLGAHTCGRGGCLVLRLLAPVCGARSVRGSGGIGIGDPADRTRERS